MADRTLKEIIQFLSKYDSLKYNIAKENQMPKTEADAALAELLTMLKELPDAWYKLKGNYQLPNYAIRDSELFYISDMGMLRILLKLGFYGQFFHELYDFLLFKILGDDINADILLPKNMKDALVELIASYLDKETKNEKNNKYKIGSY